MRYKNTNHLFRTPAAQSSATKPIPSAEYSKAERNKPASTPLPGTGRMQPPGAEKGRRNELNILAVLHKFGWLTSRQIAQLCWPTSKDPIQMSRNVIKRLKDRKEVVQRPLADNAFAYVLSSAGAARLADEYGIAARRGTDMLNGKRSSSWLHRWCANQYVLERLFSGSHAWTEYEILGNRNPFPNDDRGYKGKVPDSLINPSKATNPPRNIEWIEIELSRKNSIELDKLAVFIMESLTHQHIVLDELILDEINLVIPYDSQSKQSCDDAFKRYNSICHRVFTKLPDYLYAYSKTDQSILKRSILENTYITLMDLAPGPKLRRLCDGKWDLSYFSSSKKRLLDSKAILQDNSDIFPTSSSALP